MRCGDSECTTGEHGEDWRCLRHKKHRDSKGRKVPCKGHRLLGSQVCRMHGINEPARKTARDRLNAMVDPAMAALERALRKAEESGRELHPRVIQVALAILDRAGFHPSMKIEADVTTKDESGWFAYATNAEKKTLLGIMEKCLGRMGGKK